MRYEWFGAITPMQVVATFDKKTQEMLMKIRPYSICGLKFVFDGNMKCFGKYLMWERGWFCDKRMVYR